jgi:hypothetical protein
VEPLLRRVLLAYVAVIALLAPATATGPADSDALAMRSLVKILSRPVHTYHYTMRSRIGLSESGYVLPDHPAVRPFLRQKIDRYWDASLATRPNAQVSGLHVGVDPVASRAFGGVMQVWALVQIVLEPGLRFLDVRTPGSITGRLPQFSSDIRRSLIDRGCNAASPATLVTSLESSSCRQIALDAVRTLDVDAILYDFPSFGFEECRGRANGAFILLRHALVSAGSTTLLTSESAEDRATVDRAIIRALFESARRSGSRRELPWPATDAATLSAGSRTAWMASHLFGCGDYAEDRVPPPS